MLELDRRQAARFRMAVRRLVAGRPRGLAPPVVLENNQDGLLLYSVLEESALALRLPTASGPPAALVLPFSILAALDGPGGGVVTFGANENGDVRCRWQDRGVPKEVDCERVPPEDQPAVLPPVGTLQPVDRSLLQALHVCGQAASRESDGRFAMSRLQLRGRAGEVAGTDGRQLLLWGGFTFPFTEDLLIPAVPVFGSRELAGEQEVQIGQGGSHVVVAVGPWTIWLTIDAASRYPDVTAILPRSTRLSKLLLDDADAAALLEDLQKRPSSRDDVTSVGLDFGPRPALRWPDGTAGRRGPCNLIRSTCSGPALTIRLDPVLLARALSLGLREVRCASGNAPVLFRDEQRSYLIANLGSEAAPAVTSSTPAALPGPRLASTFPRPGDEPMNPAPNGGPPADPTLPDDVQDPLVEAEALRTALAEVARRVSRLIAWLRQFHKQRRVLHSAWTSLKHLGLGAREEP